MLYEMLSTVINNFLYHALVAWSNTDIHQLSTIKPASMSFVLLRNGCPHTLPNFMTATASVVGVRAAGLCALAVTNNSISDAILKYSINDATNMLSTAIDNIFYHPLDGRLLLLVVASASACARTPTTEIIHHLSTIKPV